STTFAVRERHARQRAEDAEGVAVNAQDDLEKAFARNLVRALSPEDNDTLAEPEAEALWELAQTPSERLWLHFLEEVTLTPLSAGQFRTGAEPALIAVVGLDMRKREQAERLLVTRLQDQGLSLRHRADLAFAALELADPESLTGELIADILTQAVATERDP